MRVDYEELGKTLAALTEGETDTVALMATVVCELHHADDRFDWTGFYRVVAPELLKIGPYQGGHGCLVIPFARGVCGAAARTGEVQIVDDVEAFPDHIACAASTRSELVLPVRNAGARFWGCWISIPISRRHLRRKMRPGWRRSWLGYLPKRNCNKHQRRQRYILLNPDDPAHLPGEGLFLGLVAEAAAGQLGGGRAPQGPEGQQMALLHPAPPVPGAMFVKPEEDPGGRIDHAKISKNKSEKRNHIKKTRKALQP